MSLERLPKASEENISNDEVYRTVNFGQQGANTQDMVNKSCYPQTILSSKDLLPGNIENCPDEAALIITDYKCENKEIKLTLRNQGLFNLYGFIARINNVSDGFFYNLKHDSDIEHFFTNDILKPNEKED